MKIDVSKLPRLNKTKPTSEQQLQMLEDWFDSERGRRVIARETDMVQQALAQAFGYHLLQLSVDARAELYDQCRIQRKFRVHPFDTSVDALCHSEQLPFESECMDVVILHHVQEFVDDPYQLLREVQRVVIPHGQVVIVGFNPWSPLGVYSALHRLTPKSHWHNRLITSLRMQDWLNLLGFETESVEFGSRMNASKFFNSPQLQRWGMNRLQHHWPFGSFYVITAVKRVASITPVKPKWKSAVAPFPGLAPVKPPVVGARPTAFCPMIPLVNHPSRKERRFT